MKKIITTVVALAATITVSFAQAPTNTGFENWTNAGTYEDPDGWGTTNFVSAFIQGFPIAAEKTTDSHSGQFAIKLTSLPCPSDLSQFGFPSDTVPGLLLLGNLGTGVLGNAYTQRPTAVSCYYKYTPSGVDSAGIIVQLTRWDSNTSQQVVVGQGLATFSNVGTYTQGIVPFQYIDNSNPDSLSIIAFSSYSALTIFGNNIPTAVAQPGSALFIDDISIVGTTPNAVNEDVAGKFDFKMYPNPVRDELSILCTGHQFANNPLTVELYDMTGRKVESFTVNQMMQKADVSSLSSGMYIYAVKNGANVMRTGKITVAK